MKIIFVLLLAFALFTTLATAFNCTKLNGEEYKVCNYIEKQSWSQSEKEKLIREAINSKDISLDGNFISILGNEVECPLQLNKLEETKFKISEKNKIFLIDFSSISLFGYIIYVFLKRYCLLLHLL